MDQHPIPQNVTGFQFKLIGSMTVKQFAYVAVGVIAAVIVYYLPVGGFFAILIKILLIPFLGSSGAIVAFIPIDGRPIDVMAGNFLQALFSPNQYIYHKTGIKFSFSNVAQNKPQTTTQVNPKTYSTPKQKLINERGLELQKLLLKSYESKVKNQQDEKEKIFLQSIMIMPVSQAAPSPLPVSASAPPTPVSKLQGVPQPLQQKIEEQKPKQQVAPNITAEEVLLEKESALKKQLEFSRNQEAGQHDQKELSEIHQKTLELEKQVKEVQNQKQSLEQEIIRLKSQLATQKVGTPVGAVTATEKPTTTLPKPATPPPTPVTASPLPVAQKPAAALPTPIPKKAPVGHVRSMSADMNKKVGLLISDTPNVISGIVKDPRGNVLQNILVEVKDKDGNPVRAFKTNALGNFASATPLAAGDYTITLEDPKKLHTFDEIKIAATNQVMLPIEIISYDKREELRKDLFS